uniref:Alternative protein ZNF609 n=1 Tax=Homo sapiens TaxID=9606 RepID=L8ECF6_HUMAN|nr:alternative protein ZNF609 [Homo sapiens]
MDLSTTKLMPIQMMTASRKRMGTVSTERNLFSMQILGAATVHLSHKKVPCPLPAQLPPKFDL